MTMMGNLHVKLGGCFELSFIVIEVGNLYKNL
jgi:hypothetical protein